MMNVDRYYIPLHLERYIFQDKTDVTSAPTTKHESRRVRKTTGIK